MRRGERFCEICGDTAHHRCLKCGRWVCSNHYDLEMKVCSYCQLTLCSICRQRLALSSCTRCGRLICENCSVKVSPVARMCRECADSLKVKEPKPPTSMIKISKEIVYRYLNFNKM